MIGVEGLDGRVAVVTGGGRGIGLRIAEVLAANGARVAALDLQRPEIDGVLGIECDVSDEPAVGAAFDEIDRTLGPASVLVLNAGILASVPFEQTSTELWERTLAINLTGAFFVVRRALPAMRAAGYGRVIGIGAAAGKSGSARSAAYAASKAGLMTLVKSIAAEYAAQRHHREHRRAGAHRHRPPGRRTRPRRARAGGAARDARRGGRPGRVPGVRARRVHHGRGGRHQRRAADRLARRAGDPRAG